MKNIISKFFIIAFLLPLLYSCDKEYMEVKPEPIFEEHGSEKISSFTNSVIAEELSAFFPTGLELQSRAEKVNYDREELIAYYYEQFFDATDLKITRTEFEAFMEEAQEMGYKDLIYFIKENEQLSDFEKEINLDIVDAVYKQDGHRLLDINKSIDVRLLENGLSESEQFRLNAQKDVFDLAFSLYPDGEGVLLQNNKSQYIVTGVLTGGLLGILQGMSLDCFTGLNYSWSPGNTSTGCLGGVLVGIVGGTIHGGARAAVGQELID